MTTQQESASVWGTALGRAVKARVLESVLKEAGVIRRQGNVNVQQTTLVLVVRKLTARTTALVVVHVTLLQASVNAPMDSQPRTAASNGA